MRILIYGAGVIGTLYGILFSKAGFDTSIYARGKRLQALREKGVLFHNHKFQIEKISRIKVVDGVDDSDRYDFVFLCVRENQLHSALYELKDNKSPHIVTMVNSLEDYSIWEEICGENRIIPAFPGAGGSIQDDVLYARLTPYIVQPTTFSSIRERKKGTFESKIAELSGIFKKAAIPYQLVEDMHVWQICHLAMVVPLADAYYANRTQEHLEQARNTNRNCTEMEENFIDKDIWKQKKVMRDTAFQLKKNFKALKDRGYKISPKKSNLFLWIPTWILAYFLSLLYRSEFANTFMYQHSLNAKEEMFELHNNFYRFLEENRV